MLLNIFFDHMNSTLELILIGIFIIAVYWFVLRKFNSLGLRLLFICSFLFVGSCVWLYKDEMKLKHTIATGEEYNATIQSKSKVGKDDNQVEVSFRDDYGKRIHTTTTEYISQKEWDKFENGNRLPVLYVPDTGDVFVKESIMRFKSDKIYLYYFAGFWLVLGVVLFVWLRKYKVGVDENGNEWVEKPDGGVMLDERKSRFMRIAKRGNIVSKILQRFGK